MPHGTVLVYGATGTQGTPVVERLLALGRRVRVLTRDARRARHWAARGAEVAVADLGRPDTLVAAHDGVDRVVLQLPLQYDFELHEAYGHSAVDATRAAGVQLVVFNTSAQVFTGTQVRAYQARQEVVDHLQRSGACSVVLRPTFFMENFLGPWIRPGIVAHGVLAFPLPREFRMSWVSTREIAAYAVAALDRPDLGGETFDVGGPEALTGEAIARHFSDALGREVSYVPLTPDEYEEELVPLFGPTVAYEVASQIRWLIARGDGSVDMRGTAAELGVEPTPLPEWIRMHDWRDAHVTA